MTSTIKYQKMNRLALALAATAYAQQKKCHALALSGGSNSGAWEVGIMYGLSHYGNPEDYHWDVVSGVSAGAINTAGTAGWAPEEVQEMSEYLSEAWHNLTSRDVWVERPDFYEAAWKEVSLLDDSPCVETIREIAGAKTEYGRKVFFGSEDPTTGEYVQYGSDNVPYEDLPIVAMGSGSIPVAFPPQHYNGHTMWDGGTVWNVNIMSAVNGCMDGIVDSYEDIVLDIVVCGYNNPDTHEVESNHALENYLSARSIRKYYTNMNALFGQERAYPGIQIRYYF